MWMVRRSEWKNIVRICQGMTLISVAVTTVSCPTTRTALVVDSSGAGRFSSSHQRTARVRCSSHGFNTFDVACLYLWVQRRVTLRAWALWLKLLSRPSQASHRRSQGWDAFVIVVEVYSFFVSQSRVCVMTKIWQYFLYGSQLQIRNVEARSARFAEIELVAKEKMFRG